MKSVEQKLFEAFKNDKPARITKRDVDSLVMDDAVGSRITDRAAFEAGADEPCGDLVPLVEGGTTWEEFKNWIKEAHG